MLDLKAGRVVHASGGARSEYRPIQSPLSPDGSPLPLVQALLDNYSCQRLYIADLDAITETGDHIDVIRLIQQLFPHLELWIDNGIRTADSLHHYYQQLPGRPVIGTETLTDLELLTRQDRHTTEPILSLDFSAAGILGNRELERRPDLWPKDVIVMSLDHIGNSVGPDFSRLARIQRLAGNRRIFAAGGIRNNQDLSLLEKAGIQGVLTATALHNGMVNPAERGSG